MLYLGLAMGAPPGLGLQVQKASGQNPTLRDLAMLFRIESIRKSERARLKCKFAHWPWMRGDPRNSRPVTLSRAAWPYVHTRFKL